MGNDLMRKLIEGAVSTGRKMQSPQTRFVHFNPHAGEDGRHDTIPTQENFLFVLALFRTRSSEQIQEGKELLDRLLSYQGRDGDEEGNFPVYLHEFPSCHSRRQAMKVLPALYWIQKDFGKILRDRLKEHLEKLVQYCLKSVKEKPADELTLLRIGAGAVAVGRLIGREDWIEEGSRMLDQVEQPGWFSRRGIGEALISLQMIPDFSLDKFWEHVRSTWHTELGVYCGPALDEWQKGPLPEPAVYDLFLALLSGKEAAYEMLQGALVRPIDTLQTSGHGDFEGMRLGNSWKIMRGKEFACCAIASNSEKEKGFHPLMLYWRSGDQLLSLSCEGGNFTETGFSAAEQRIELDFTVPCPISIDHPYENREIQFFSNTMRMTVDGVPTTTFHLGDRILIGEDARVSIQFELLEGEGQFVGHLMPGNRPSQTVKQAIMPAFDRQIFLRTIRKKSPCRIRAVIEIDVQ